MKKALLLFIFSFGVINYAAAQQILQRTNQTPQELYDFHISKKKGNNLAGWLALGGGLVTTITGIVLVGNDVVDAVDFNEKTEPRNREWLVYVGGAMTVGSIPLFIAAGKHKKKAQIQLQHGAIGLNKINYSGVSITFSF